MKATLVAAGNRIPNGMDRRLSKEGGFAYVCIGACLESIDGTRSSIATASPSRASLGSIVLRHTTLMHFQCKVGEHGAECTDCYIDTPRDFVFL